MKKIIFFALTLLPLVSNAAVENNSGYAKVVQVKVWPTYIDIYLDIGGVCSNESQKTRYVLDKTETEMYSTLLTAMTAGLVVNLNYDCGTNGIAQIYGVRAKPQS